jgi:serine/threonine protein kinase/tetratricopeptide (TPR) repeat protein
MDNDQPNKKMQVQDSEQTPETAPPWQAGTQEYFGTTPGGPRRGDGNSGHAHDRSGQSFGDYELLDKLGEGGMGVVYRARQCSADRIVALKVIRPDCLMALSPESRDHAIQRFITEAKAAARLEHENIVTVYDVGDIDGQPYYSMRYIEGRSLGHILRMGPLENRRAAELLEPIARAVHYAHERGILHRDLKPVNIMVQEGLEARDDGRGTGGRGTSRSNSRVFVTDFGLAKLTESSSEMTRTGQIMGTPAYMSPEQAQDASRCTAISDVYSLGAALYDLLTARPPFRAANPIETLRQVIEQDPVAPRVLNSAIDRDLDTIALKCLAKEPRRRYGSAAELADDLERYINREPIRARPIPLPARIWRWSYRNRPAAAAIAATFLATMVMVGAVITVSHKNRQLAGANLELMSANSREREATNAATENEQLAKAQKAAAIRAADDMKAVLKYFQDTVLAAGRPDTQEGGLGIHATIRAAIDAAEPKIASSFPDQPTVEAQIRYTMGMTYSYLAEPELAVKQFRRSLDLFEQELGPDDPNTLMCANNLGASYTIQGNYTDAVPLLEDTLACQSRHLELDHPDTLLTMHNLAMAYYQVGRMSEALQLMRESLKRTTAALGPQHAETLSRMRNVASVELMAGRHDEARDALEEILSIQKTVLGPKHPETVQTMNCLADAYRLKGRWTEAITTSKEALDIATTQLGPDHIETLRSVNALANSYQGSGRLSEAVELRQKAVELAKAKYGPENPETLRYTKNLASSYYSAARFSDALDLLSATMDFLKATLGTKNPATLDCMNALGSTLFSSGKLDDALPILEETVELMNEVLGPDHEETVNCMNNLGMAYDGLKRGSDAVPLLDHVLTLRRATLGDASPETITSMNNLALACQHSDQLPRASSLFEQALGLARTTFPPGHTTTLSILNNLAGLHFRTGKFNEAAALFTDALDGLQRELGLEHPHTQTCIRNLAACYAKLDMPGRAEPLLSDLVTASKRTFGRYSQQHNVQLIQLAMNQLEQKKYAEAEPLLREALIICQKTQPDDWSTFVTTSLVGVALAKQKKYPEAETMLLDAYSGLSKYKEQIPLTARHHLTTAIQNLIEVYTLWEKSQEAEHWRRKLNAEKEAGN